MILYITAGFLTGMLMGLTGVGGGAVMTPILLLLFGIAPATAIGTDLWFASLTKSVAVGMHHNTNLIDWMVVRRMWAGSLPATAITILLMKFGYIGVDVRLLKYGIGIAVVLTALSILFKQQLHNLGQNFRLRDAGQFKQLQFPLTILSGLLLGVMVSLTSIGAGAFGAMILTYLYPLRMTPHKLVATDIAHAIPLTMIAGLGHLLIGNVNFSLLGQLMLGSVPGVILGVFLSTRLPQEWLRYAIVLCLLLVGGKLLLS
ncbi:sulfite exporter TauE/SafE family protein [Massilia sp. W12]|uniref:sulfite exporter TauE/SafE family protein n=1 Tax=Massilia sp. W12 TaxID=3126507 RepID=UPI0030CAEF5C